MGVIHDFPYTNIGELNTDWILKVIKEFYEKYSGIDEALDHAIETIVEQEDTSKTALLTLQTAIETSINTLYDTLEAEANSAQTEHLAELQTKTTQGLTQMQNFLNSMPADVQEIIADLTEFDKAINDLTDKNFFNFSVYGSAETKTNGGITYTPLGNGKWSAVGTATADSKYWIFDETTFNHLKAGKSYKITFIPGNNAIALATYKRTAGGLVRNDPVNGILTIGDDATGFMFRIDIPNGTTVDTVMTFYVDNIPADIENIKSDIDTRLTFDETQLANLEQQNFFDFAIFGSGAQTRQGVVYTPLGNGVWSAVGTASGVSRYWIFDDVDMSWLKPGKSYNVSFTSTDANITAVYYRRTAGGSVQNSPVDGVLTVGDNATGFFVRVDIPDGTTVDATIEFHIQNIPDGITAVMDTLEAELGSAVLTNENQHAAITRIVDENRYFNILDGNYKGVDETWRGVTYNWYGNIVRVTGQASSTSYSDIYKSINGLPSGMVAGETYAIMYEGTNVQIRVFAYVDGSLVTTPLKTTTTKTFFTLPAEATGFMVRMYVTDTTVVLDEIVDCEIYLFTKPETLVFPHKIAFFGDSIMKGRDGDGTGSNVNTPYPIPETVSKRLGVIADNYGVGSMGYVSLGGGQNAYDKISSTDLSTYDIIVICFGVNDGFQPIGTYDSANESEVMGQFNKIINYIYGEKPACQVIVIAPFNGCNAGSFPKYWYGTPGGQAYSRGLLSDTLKQACEYYNIPYIEQKNGPVNGFTVKKNILDANNKSLTYMGADGVHPSNAGYKAIGEWIAGELAKLI